jgi:hypothetical protein
MRRLIPWLLATVIAFALSGCRSGTSSESEARRSSSSLHALAAVRNLRIGWQSDLKFGAQADPTKTFPSPSRHRLVEQLREAAKRYGFTIVRISTLRPLDLAPLVVVRTAEPAKFSRDITTKVVRAIDPKKRTIDDRDGWAYEGLFFVALDDESVPFLAVFNHWRGPHAGGGQWAASPELLPFPHSGVVS